MQDSSPTAPTLEPEPQTRSGLLALLLVAVGVYAFLLLMAYYEPITGDGWYVASDDVRYGHGIQAITDRLVLNHNRSNPRLGQLFTLLVYAPPLHLIFTPLIISLLFVLVFVHAVGRWPRATLRDACLSLSAVAFCWLATPAPGHTYFYRPITTNYIYSFTLTLLYFLPFRLGVQATTKLRAALWAALLFLCGVAAGKLNEHTGPAVVMVAGVYAFFAARQKRWLDFAWMSSATLGLSIGYCYLFFAPGLRRRVGHVGKRETVLDTVLKRGFEGNFELLHNFVVYVAPLLAALCIVLVLLASARSSKALTSALQAERLRAMAVYVLLAGLIVGISLAAPRSHYRLAIAPALLCAIAALGVVELLSRDALVRNVLGVLALGVHLVFAYVFIDLYSSLHADEVTRVQLAQGTKPNEVLYVPRMRRYQASPLFYGDTLGGEPRHRRRMAMMYDIAEVRSGRAHRVPASKVVRKVKRPKRSGPRL